MVICKYLFLFLQGHLSSSQLFVFFVVFVFVMIVSGMREKSSVKISFTGYNQVLRDLCEVEFWEVFFRKCTRVFRVVP